MTIFPHFLMRLAAVIAIAVMPCVHAQAIDPAKTEQVITPSAKAAEQASKATDAAGAKSQLSGPALLFVTAIIILGAFFFIKRAKNGLGGKLSQTAKGAIEVCRTRSLGGKQYLVVVQVEGKRILLGVCPASINKLADLEPEDFSIPFERKEKPATTKPEGVETPTYPFTNLITRINDSLSRKDDKNGGDDRK